MVYISFASLVAKFTAYFGHKLCCYSHVVRHVRVRMMLQLEKELEPEQVERFLVVAFLLLEAYLVFQVPSSL